PRSIFLTPARCSRSITSSALFGWSDTYASLREAWIAAPRGLPPVLISPTTSSRAVSISEIVPAFSLPTRARPAPAGAAIDARIKKTEIRPVIAALSSNHAEIAHHHAVFVLQIVAVEHKALGAPERGLLRQREVHRQPQRLVRPQHHGVLHAEVGGQASARLGREPRGGLRERREPRGQRRRAHRSTVDAQREKRQLGAVGQSTLRGA